MMMGITARRSVKMTVHRLNQPQMRSRTPGLRFCICAGALSSRFSSLSCTKELLSTCDLENGIEAIEAI